MRVGSRRCWWFAPGIAAWLAVSGCATTRYRDPNPLLRPCTDGFTRTADGWVLGIRRIRPRHPDPAKLPVVLCHGMGLNGTFWTLTDDHLGEQLADRGYEVFIPDMRGSGASHRVGPVSRVNAFLRETPFLEVGDGKWTMDDEVRYDVPAILDYVAAQTGSDRVNWVGHSLGGMLMFAYLETAPGPERIANFVAMGSTIALANAPERDMLWANRGLRLLQYFLSPGRLGRPMKHYQPPGLQVIDGFYYTAANVDQRTVARFYANTLENPGRGALRQLDPYLRRGHLLSADRTIDYVEGLPKVRNPLLMIAGDGDCMSDIPSTLITYNRVSSPDKTLLRFGKREGHVDDYGHCDLVWSRHAPREIFPVLIDWLDRRQPRATPQAQASPQGPGG